MFTFVLSLLHVCDTSAFPLRPTETKVSLKILSGLVSHWIEEIFIVKITLRSYSVSLQAAGAVKQLNHCQKFGISTDS